MEFSEGETVFDVAIFIIDYDSVFLVIMILAKKFWGKGEEVKEAEAEAKPCALSRTVPEPNRTAANGVATDTCRGKERFGELTGNDTGNWKNRDHPL